MPKPTRKSQAEALVRQGFQAQQAGDTAGAVAAYKAALRLHPAEPNALQLLGLLAGKLGDAAGATLHRALSQPVAARPRRGSFRFGAPDFDAGPTMPVQHLVQPRTGRLLLFPSMLWHGTVPFDSDAERLTVAFDLVPV